MASDGRWEVPADAQTTTPAAPWRARHQRPSSVLAPSTDHERLDTRLVRSSHDAKMSVLAPACAPRVGTQLKRTHNTHTETQKIRSATNSKRSHTTCATITRAHNNRWVARLVYRRTQQNINEKKFKPKKTRNLTIANKRRNAFI